MILDDKPVLPRRPAADDEPPAGSPTTGDMTADDRAADDPAVPGATVPGGPRSRGGAAATAGPGAVPPVRATPLDAAWWRSRPQQPSLARRFGSGSLKSRMAMVLGVVLVLPTLYAAAQTWLAWRSESVRQLELLERTAQLISAYQSDLVERTWTILNEVARQPVVLQMQEPGCSDLLANELAQSHSYGNLMAVDAGGTARCASDQKLKGLSVADRGWFQETRRGPGPVLSKVLDSRDPSSGRTVIAAFPLNEEIGGSAVFRGALGVSLRLNQFTFATKDLRLPQDAVAYVVDRVGTSLQFGASGVPLPLPSAQQNLVILNNSEHAVTLVGPSGRYWLYLATPIARGQLAVIVGLPIQPWAWLREDLLLGIMIPTAMLALAVLAIWMATDYLVNRHIVTLARSAVAYRQGRVGTLPPTDDAPSEIRALAKALTDTAAEVRARETELEASLRQKDMLLREIHHRIKNNLQIVVSLLNLRAQRLGSSTARTALAEAQTRIKALALVHRHLYEQPEVEAVELHAFLGDLCALIEDTTAPAAPVTVTVDVAPVTVSTDQAIPIALLVTEILSNAFKHAFPDDRGGRIEVRLASTAGGALLEIVDDGVGYGLPGAAPVGTGQPAGSRSTVAEPAAGRDAPRPASDRPAVAEAGVGRDAPRPVWGGGGGEGHGLGLTLVRMLARQIGGELKIESDRHGTRLSLPFPLSRTP